MRDSYDTKEFEDKLLIKWSLPELRGFQIPKPLHGKHSHHWAYDTWDLLNKEGFLPILDYEYEEPEKIDEEQLGLPSEQTNKKNTEDRGGQERLHTVILLLHHIHFRVTTRM